MATVENIIPTDGIFLSITKTAEGQEIITNHFTPYKGLTNDEIIELIETDNRLYRMEILRRKAIRRAKANNRIKIALINIIRSL